MVRGLAARAGATEPGRSFAAAVDVETVGDGQGNRTIAITLAITAEQADGSQIMIAIRQSVGHRQRRAAAVRPRGRGASRHSTVYSVAGAEQPAQHAPALVDGRLQCMSARRPGHRPPMLPVHGLVQGTAAILRHLMTGMHRTASTKQPAVGTNARSPGEERGLLHANTGAGDGTRTRTESPPTVFKTAASAISPLRHAAIIQACCRAVEVLATWQATRRRPAQFRGATCREPASGTCHPRQYHPLTSMHHSSSSNACGSSVWLAFGRRALGTGSASPDERGPSRRRLTLGDSGSARDEPNPNA